ncbi:hypothetical protein ABT084_22130 [Streptomyces sp. NPDC002138]|uniref:hypothetical protein n=1 Tax=Streptomyces sp. NPDC002138 TaxID=3154410 RepID=UPI003330B608
MTQYLRRLAGTALAVAALTPALTSAVTTLAATPAQAAHAAHARTAATRVVTARIAPAHTAPAPVRHVLPRPDGPTDDELAGSAAGAGREHPGRPADEPANPETVLASRPLPMRPRPVEQIAPPRTQPPPSAAPPAQALGTGPNERAADLAAHILPLGTGFALMGVGLGYMGMRLRRG